MPYIIIFLCLLLPQYAETANAKETNIERLYNEFHFTPLEIHGTLYARN